MATDQHGRSRPHAQVGVKKAGLPSTTAKLGAVSATDRLVDALPTLLLIETEALRLMFVPMQSDERRQPTAQQP